MDSWGTVKAHVGAKVLEMVKPGSQFLFGIESECLTALPDRPGEAELFALRLLKYLAKQAPSIRSTQGYFNGYAKFYFDVGHIELATVECDSPYLLPSIVERIEILVGRALKVLGECEDGVRLVLANNNHSGLLRPGCPVWGTHENYLVEAPPESFTEQILPFLVTRIYAGAGAVHYPTGEFLAGVRPTCMETHTGGGTTDTRAIHSTARSESHMSSAQALYRYHLISGDGHRSQFNLALQVGATALAIKAILFDPETKRQVGRWSSQFGPSWVSTIKQLNVLAGPNCSLHIDPLIVRTQRVYLKGARRYAESVSELPDWVPRLLEDWEQTLLAYERVDRSWLAARFDTFAKYELFSAVVQQSGKNWDSLRASKPLFSELALLNQGYHEFCNPESVFRKLEQANMLKHRVVPLTQPGQERDAFVPETRTRARARARFIKENHEKRGMELDWAYAYDHDASQAFGLGTPFAEEFVAIDEERAPNPRVHLALHGRRNRELMNRAIVLYDRGDFHGCERYLQQAAHVGALRADLPGTPSRLMRYFAWTRARQGYTDAVRMVHEAHRDHANTWSAIADWVNVLRFQGFMPDLEQVHPWIDRANELLSSLRRGEREPEDAAVYRDHVAACMLRHGLVDQADQLVRQPLLNRQMRHVHPYMQARLIATRGEIRRIQGRRNAARRLLKTAERIQLDQRYLGYLNFVTLPALAKCAETEHEARDFLDRAIALQQRGTDYFGLVQSWLLQARILDDPQLAAGNHDEIRSHCCDVPALANCSKLTHILEHWGSWTSGELASEHPGDFWGI